MRLKAFENKNSIQFPFFKIYKTNFTHIPFRVHSPSFLFQEVISQSSFIDEPRKIDLYVIALRALRFEDAPIDNLVSGERGGMGVYNLNKQCIAKWPRIGYGSPCLRGPIDSQTFLNEWPSDERTEYWVSTAEVFWFIVWTF